MRFNLGLLRNLHLGNKTTQSEAKFQALIRYAGDAIFIVAPNYQITEVNDSACRLLNYSSEELQQMKVYEIIAMDNPQSFEDRTKIIHDEGGSLHERKLKRKDGSLVDTEINVRTVEGVGYIAIIRDITERKKTAAKIHEREAQLTALFDNIEGSLGMLDVNKKIVLFNSRFAHNYKLLTNQDPQVGDGAYDFFPDEMKKGPSRLMDSALKGNKEVFENEYLKDGKPVRFRTSYNPVITDGKIIGITSYSLDLTESREAEMKIKQSEERFRSLIAVSNTGGWEYHSDAQFVWCSPEYFAMIGRKVSDYDMSGAVNLKEVWMDLLHPEDKERAISQFAEYLKNGSVGTYENYFRMQHANGSWVWIWSRGQTLRNAEGKLTNLTVGTHIDITELKSAEIKVRESEEKFRLAFMTSQDAFYIGTLDNGRIIDANNSFYDLFGYTKEDSIGKTTTELRLFAYPEDRVKMVAELKTNGNLKNLELTCRRKNGELVIVSVTANVWQMNNEQVIMAVIRDITEQKRVETELIERKEQMALFVEYSPASLAMFDNQMRYVATSRRWLADYNLKDREIIGKSHYEVFPEITQDWKDIHDRCLKGSIEGKDEDSFTRADGTTDWLKWEIRPWHKASGEIGGIIMFTEVITERKESELKFKNLVEKSLVGVYIIQKGKYAYVNPKFGEILGYTQEEMLNMEDVRNIVHTEYKPEALVQWRKKVDAGIIDDFHIELQYKKKNGAIIWAEVYCGETLYRGTKAILGTFQDITERKNAETVIKEQAETFSAIMEHANESILLLSPDLKVLQFNKTAKDRLLLNHGKEIYPGADYRELLHTGTENVFITMFNDAATGKYPELESSQTNIHGEIFWLRTRMYPVYDTQKKLIGITVLTESITDRKKTEESIKQSEANYRQLFDNSPAPMWVIDESTSAIMRVNKACIKNYGFSEAEFLGMTISDINPAETRNTGIMNTFFMGSHRHLKKSGELIDVVTSSIPVRLNGEKSILMIAIDVTEKNLYEQKLTKASLKVQEEERYEIGGELHDNVCQILAGSLMCLGLMKKSVPDESIGMFDQTYKYINQATNEIRGLSHRLAPALFNDQSLEDAFIILLKSFNVENKYSISLTVDPQFKKQALSRDLQLNLYRILQEQLRNITKHANATKIEIDLSVKKNKVLRMEVTDNGVGFNAEAAKGGIGLANMNRRVQLFSGHFTINSAVGKGCTVLAEIPLSSTG